MKRHLLSAFFLLGLVSCGPVYETKHSFTPPRSAEGRSCTFQCQTVKLQCQQIEEMQQRQCEDHARWQQRRCQEDLADRGKKERWYDCGLESCTANTERCEESYRACYQSCGGQVESREVCTYNCDKIPAGQGR
ncbi:MAG: hypothetical protein J0M12_01080 [Deltaproteobacteria bacterium]|nr:hypothetical protein [Deltaproteobacteria bacterium]